MKVRPKQRPIISAWLANVEARSTSPAPSARAIADATPPPMAPPDIVMVSITHGNTSAIAASDSTPSRPIYDVSAITTQVPAVSAITLGQASDSNVRRIGPSTSAFFAGAGGGG